MPYTYTDPLVHAKFSLAHFMQRRASRQQVKMAAFEEIINARHASLLPLTVRSSAICPACAVCARDRKRCLRDRFASAIIPAMRKSSTRAVKHEPDVHRPEINAISSCFNFLTRRVKPLLSFIRTTDKIPT